MNVPFLRCAAALAAASFLPLAAAAASASPTWHERVLYSFAGGADGFYPSGALIADAKGALYGVTGSGGACASNPGTGCGTVFRLSPPATGTGAWTKTVLYAFAGGPTDGLEPQGALVADASGSLYGTTQRSGGSTDFGTVFKLTYTPGGYRESVLYTFLGGAGGKYPDGSLLLDAHGALYGEAGGGSRGAGIVFKLCPPDGRSSTWSERVLYTFGATPKDGTNPARGLTAGPDGALYGVTSTGGGYPSSTYSFDGTIFKLTPPPASADTWTESILYAFKSQADGTQPSGQVILGPNGRIFGATSVGGAYVNGTVFELLPPVRGRPGCVHCVIASLGQFLGANTFTLAAPRSPLILDGSGNLYVAAQQGGPGNHGGILMLTPPAGGGTTYTQTDLYDFKGSPDGEIPLAGLLRVGSKGFGTTELGGLGWGTVYELSK